MIARTMLIVSSVTTLLVGSGLVTFGIHFHVGSDIASKLVARLDLSPMPNAAALKLDIEERFRASGIAQGMGWVLIGSGVMINFASALGLWGSVTGSSFGLVMYLVAKSVGAVAFLISLILITGADAVFERPILDRLLKLQNTQFVSIVSLFDNSANDSLLFTVLLNVIQRDLGCCGMESRGDTRSSPTWLTSPRSLAGPLKLQDIQHPAPPLPNLIPLPGWLNGRMPTGVRQLWLPINLPRALPEGVRIPDRFNVTRGILTNTSAIETLFKESLVLRTPITCCKYKKNAVFTFNATTLVADLEDHNCPFQAESSAGVYNETCFAKMYFILGDYYLWMILTVIFIGCSLACNISLATFLLMW